MPKKPWYDDPEQIEQRLSVDDLPALHELFLERSQAAYGRKERLDVCVVLHGRYQLDENGNVWEAEHPEALKSLFRFGLVHPGKIKAGWHAADEEEAGMMLSWRMPPSHSLPRSGQRCDVCGLGWNLRTCHDAVAVPVGGDGPPRHEHKECRRASLANEARAFWVEIFEAAGFQKIEHAQHPNRYCPCDRCMPWARVTTEGGSILIGWRKRVIHIELESWSIELDALLSHEEVTKARHLIHAWSRDKAVEYLSKIRLAWAAAAEAAPRRTER